ncbi:MAG: AMP-binding protein, partial [Nitrososphaera sp.]|nr:AMP-binding protein [Nitrososphaera sp.]
MMPWCGWRSPTARTPRTCWSRSGSRRWSSTRAGRRSGPTTSRGADECGMVFTSGTTSRPKGCLITHANYVYAGESVSKSLRLAPEQQHLARVGPD